MFDIPLGKAIAPVQVERDDMCGDCILFKKRYRGLCPAMKCDRNVRKDGKNVIFKLVDYKGDGK